SFILFLPLLFTSFLTLILAFPPEDRDSRYSRSRSRSRRRSDSRSRQRSGRAGSRRRYDRTRDRNRERDRDRDRGRRYTGRRRTRQESLLKIFKP
ncbi:hypothetical protein M9458_036476, partial [Cirrhinus mrigala]